MKKIFLPMDDLFTNLNKQQIEAVQTKEKHVLILAGAGTGKTRAVTARMIFLLKKKNVSPRNILAVTFTNKAANEMKERIWSYLGHEMDIMIRFPAICSFSNNGPKKADSICLPQ